MGAAYRNSTPQTLDTASSGTIVNTYDAAVLSGSLLWCFVSFDASSSQTVTGVSDSVNGAWVSAGTPPANNADGQRLEIWYKENSAAGTPVVTVTLSAAAIFRGVELIEATGVATSSSLDKYAAANGTNGSPSSGSQTTTANGEYIAGGLYHSGTTVSSYGSFTNRENAEVSADVSDFVQTSAGSISFDTTLSGAGTWTAVMATFKAAADVGDLSVNSIGEPVIGGSTF